MAARESGLPAELWWLQELAGPWVSATGDWIAAIAPPKEMRTACSDSRAMRPAEQRSALKSNGPQQLSSHTPVRRPSREPACFRLEAAPLLWKTRVYSDLVCTSMSTGLAFWLTTAGRALEKGTNATGAERCTPLSSYGISIVPFFADRTAALESRTTKRTM